MTLRSKSFYEFLSAFAPAFNAPSFRNFLTITTGWLLCASRHSVSQVLRTPVGVRHPRHFSTLYRFFARASWCVDQIGHVLFTLVVSAVPDRQLLVLVDDTLCRRTGSHVWGAGMHLDILRSNYATRVSKRRHVAFAFGHNWVVLSIWVPLPWNPERGIAVPVLVRLYRTKKLTQAADYQKRTVIARELIATAGRWARDFDRTLMISTDSEYACQTILKKLPPDAQFVGPIVMHAALLCAEAQIERNHRGRPRRRGAQIGSPSSLLNDPTLPWQRVVVRIYSRDVELLVKTLVCQWYRVAGKRDVRLVLTRDPRGRWKDRTYFSTVADSSVQSVLTTVARRWATEHTFYNVKQHLGIQQPQNGWWRRRRRGPTRRGKRSYAHRTRGRQAAERTAPLVFYTYAMTWIWYLVNGDPARDVAAARIIAPWYRTKREPSYGDVISAVRRDIAPNMHFPSDPVEMRVMKEIGALPSTRRKAA